MRMELKTREGIRVAVLRNLVSTSRKHHASSTKDSYSAKNQYVTKTARTYSEDEETKNPRGCSGHETKWKVGRKVRKNVKE
jgi:hypothetical protein